MELLTVFYGLAALAIVVILYIYGAFKLCKYIIEEEWRRKVFLAMDKIDHTDKTHDISYLLEEPCRKPEYTLDFCCKVFTGKSPLVDALYHRCSSCLVKLLDAGASVHYPVPKHSCHLTPLALAIEDEAGVDDEHGATEQKELLEELLRRGANDNDGYLHGRASGLVLATRLKRPATMQMLLDYGVGLPACERDNTRNPLLSIIWYNCERELNICLDHVEKYNLNFNLDVIFEVFSSRCNENNKRNSQGEKEMNKNIFRGAQIILRRGYLADLNSVHAQTFFCKALEKNTVESDKVVSIMLDQSPIMLQVCRNLLDMDTIDQKYLHQLENAPSLQSLCKGVIIASMRQPYVGKIKYLPLPVSIKASLELRDY